MKMLKKKLPGDFKRRSKSKDQAVSDSEDADSRTRKC